MTPPTPLRLEHLRRLTDSLGLMHAARGEVPDRFEGYHTLDNAEALRLCALASTTVSAETFAGLAKVYFGFLTRGRGEDGRVRHLCDARGKWHNSVDDALVQARLAVALASVMVSELPKDLRLAAAHWWPKLLVHAERAGTPSSAANWLIALGQLRAADPGRDLKRAEQLARRLVEEGYNPCRSGDWEWFELAWSPTAAIIPAGLWFAADLLGNRDYADVAAAGARFVIDQLFDEGTLAPVGTFGGWSRGGRKALYNQLPTETCSVVELLCAAERHAGRPRYGRLAEAAGRWFTGSNGQGTEMIDPQSGGCYDALTAQGPDRNQGAPAMVAYLLTQALLATRTAVVEESPIYVTT